MLLEPFIKDTAFYRINMLNIMYMHLCLSLDCISLETTGCYHCQFHVLYLHSTHYPSDILKLSTYEVLGHTKHHDDKVPYILALLFLGERQKLVVAHLTAGNKERWGKGVSGRKPFGAGLARKSLRMMEQLSRWLGTTTCGDLKKRTPAGATGTSKVPRRPASAALALSSYGIPL